MKHKNIDEFLALFSRIVPADRRCGIMAFKRAGYPKSWLREAVHKFPIPANASRPPPPRPKGIGDHLAAAIHAQLGIPPCGDCDGMRRRMNEWGAAGCLLHSVEIVAWLVKRATKRSIPVDVPTVAGMVAEFLKQTARTAVDSLK